MYPQAVVLREVQMSQLIKLVRCYALIDKLGLFVRFVLLRVSQLCVQGGMGLVQAYCGTWGLSQLIVGYGTCFSLKWGMGLVQAYSGFLDSPV